MARTTFGERMDEASPLAFLKFWQLDSAEIRREVAGYDTFGVTASARGRSALLALLLAGLGLVGGALLGDVLVGVVQAALWAAIAFGCYRGARPAFVMAMILFTLDRAVALASLAGPLWQLCWWAVGMALFLRAHAVERVRRLAASDTSPAV